MALTFVEEFYWDADCAHGVLRVVVGDGESLAELNRQVKISRVLKILGRELFFPRQ